MTAANDLNLLLADLAKLDLIRERQPKRWRAHQSSYERWRATLAQRIEELQAEVLT